ncbi:MAG: iron-containing alcohol dehydrogenase [Alphaproteobacteria bacterium]|nr:iron-containing alcohol dehydrogenase [Alphaproteobacteria bacterium]
MATLSPTAATSTRRPVKNTTNACWRFIGATSAKDHSMLNGIHGHQDIERVVYGRPAGAALRAESERLGARRVFVMTTKSVAQSALLADMIRDLGDRYAGVYAGITAHSPRPCVIEGAALAREAKADLIVAVGGGSAIDATKAILIALWQNATSIEDLDLYRAGKPKEGAAPPSEAIKPPADAIRMIAVPTTLSAAEFNAFAGITDPRYGIKESFGDRHLIVDYSFAWIGGLFAYHELSDALIIT